MEINNLMENVREFFTEQYKGVEKSNSYLSFEPLGCMIDPNDFKDGNNLDSEIKATEQLSILGDRLPEIEDVFLTGTSRFSDVYEELIESAVFSGMKINAEDKAPYIGKFSEVKTESIFKFNEGKKASISTPEGNYLPVYGSPKKWYEPESAFWVGKTFSVKEKIEAPAPKTPSAPIKLLPLVWRTKFVANTEKLKEVKLARPALRPNLTLTRPGVKTAMHTKPIMMVAKPSSKGPTPTAKASLKKRANLAAFAAPGRSNPNVPKAVSAKENGIGQNTVWKDLKILKHLDVADRLKFTANIARANTAPVEPVHSKEFSMSFDYCFVNLERPWFDTSMFHYSNLWYCLSLPEDYFSTGDKDKANSGVLKSIPTAMILIKDLRIKAAWTEDDKTIAKNSIGLGIFNLNDSRFIDNELVTPGMQIIGWMCEILPKLPTMPDPNMVV